MIAAQTLALMDDQHLISSLHADFDSLTSTPAEIELLRRFEEVAHDRERFTVLGEQEFTPEDITALATISNVTEAAKLLDALGDSEIYNAADWNEKRALLNVLDDAEIDGPERLRELLDIASVVG